MILTPEDLLKIVIALLIGGVIGLEREYRDKPAGFRTLIFICIGAALFTILSTHLEGGSGSTRIAANIVSGVGFLGAGVILRENRKVAGLTTASTIWLTAALGMGIGGGQYLLSVSVTTIILLVLWVFPLLERKIATTRVEHNYQIVCGLSLEYLTELETLFEQSGLHVIDHQKVMADQKITSSWQAIGSRKTHADLTAKLIQRQYIIELRW